MSNAYMFPAGSFLATHQCVKYVSHGCNDPLQPAMLESGHLLRAALDLLGTWWPGNPTLRCLDAGPNTRLRIRKEMVMTMLRGRVELEAALLIMMMMMNMVIMVHSHGT